MAGITRLAEKKFKLLFAPDRKELFEEIFYKNFLIHGFNFSNSTVKALYLKDIPQLAERCKRFGVQIIGIETSLDSAYPLTVKVFEDFTGNVYKPEWIERCIDELKKENITNDLVIYINIPNSVLDILIQTFQLTQ